MGDAGDPCATEILQVATSPAQCCSLYSWFLTIVSTGFAAIYVRQVTVSPTALTNVSLQIAELVFPGDFQLYVCTAFPRGTVLGPYREHDPTNR